MSSEAQKSMIPSWGQLLYGILRISEGGLTPLNFYKLGAW